MKKILAAMSGGVDSAAAVLALQAEGYHVDGATMLLHPYGAAEAEEARRTAAALGIGFYCFDWQDEFRRAVIEPFKAAYGRGETPNPCIFCNKALKFGRFLAMAQTLGYDAVATGHYARLTREHGRWLLYTARDGKKDQTYMLYGLTQDQLARVMFPMGDLSKGEARAMTAAAGLTVSSKHDSQDICFIPDGDYLRFLREDGAVLHPGRFVGPDGEDLGPHKGQEAYTTGQRRGLEVAYGQRIYVTGKDADGTVRLGPDEALYQTRVAVRDVNFQPFDALHTPLRAQAKVRYSPQAAPCTIYPTETGVELVFDTPQRAVTPGQAAVFYDGPLLLGGGTIAAKASP